MIVTQQYTKGIGETVDEIKEAVGEFTPYEKVTFSCMETEEIKNAIVNSGKKTVIVCGTEAHICVLQTMIQLKEMGYNVVYVENCSGSRKDHDKKMALKRAMAEGIIPTTYEALLFELTETAKNPVFKTISNLIK